MAAALAKVGVLFVCMANICRSPTAEGVFRHRVEQARLDKRIRIDSAGTHAFHVGERPDKRSVAAAARRQYDLARIKARKIAVDDFARFEFVLAMDRDNLTQLARLRPAGHTGHVGLLLDFAPGFEARDVPDPYYGGIQGFELVLDLVEAAADGLLARVRETLGES
ncbi:MAG: low molecular weight protein-tyrosine-phosphatase [Betaproteobacteria bacterium]